jgi:RIO kinase 1
MRTPPLWLIDEPWTDADLGIIKSGKEAQVNLVERTNDVGEACLLARKRYLPREVKTKGQLDALGVQRASTFVNDARYREGRSFRKSRDRRAVAKRSAYGKQVMQDMWAGQEHEIMSQLWDAGMPVPFPIAYADDVFDMEYVGDSSQAAPQLHAARLDKTELGRAFDQLVDGLRCLTSEGLVHGDLSVYNLLWWHGDLWFIDFPQTIDLAANLQGLDFLHRDIVNVCTWFNRKGHAADPDELFAELLSYT